MFFPVGKSKIKLLSNQLLVLFPERIGNREEFFPHFSVFRMKDTFILASIPCEVQSNRPMLTRGEVKSKVLIKRRETTDIAVQEIPTEIVIPDAPHQTRKIAAKSTISFVFRFWGIIRIDMKGKLCHLF